MIVPTTQNADPPGLHVRYEKAGLILDSLPIPWNADALIVEANVRLPANEPRVKQDFTLRTAVDAPAVSAELIAQESKQTPIRVFFRVSVPAQTCTVQVLWRGHPLGQIEVPVISAPAFVQDFSLEMPTLHVALGNRTVACQSFVNTQVKTVLASALVRSSGPLAAAFELDLRVQVQRGDGQYVGAVLASLTSAQLRARQALVTVLLPRLRTLGTYQVSWHLATRCLHAQTVRVVSRKAFLRSLRISAARFVLHKDNDTLQTVRSLPARDGKPLLDGIAQVAPCFYVCSGESGMAGIAPFTLRVLAADVITTLAIKDDVLVTDGPTPIVLGVVSARELGNLKHFTLGIGDTILGNLPLVPAPKAEFNAEGGFAPLDDFLWSAAAEEQLNERLGKLLDRDRD
jgi:hypothetical protein